MASYTACAGGRSSSTRTTVRRLQSTPPSTTAPPSSTSSRPSTPLVAMLRHDWHQKHWLKLSLQRLWTERAPAPQLRDCECPVPPRITGARNSMQEIVSRLNTRISSRRKRRHCLHMNDLSITCSQLGTILQCYGATTKEVAHMCIASSPQRRSPDSEI